MTTMARDEIIEANCYRRYPETKSLLFGINEKQLDKMYAWDREHVIARHSCEVYFHPLEGRLTFHCNQGVLGSTALITKVVCACGEIYDLTDYTLTETCIIKGQRQSNIEFPNTRQGKEIRETMRRLDTSEEYRALTEKFTKAREELAQIERTKIEFELATGAAARTEIDSTSTSTS